MNRRKFITAAGAFGIIGAFSPKQSSFGIDTSDKNKVGEEMFKGIFFFQGEYAETLMRNKAFGSIDHNQRKEILSSANSDEALNTSRIIISQLKDNDKNIFSSLYDSIRTGDPYKVYYQLNLIIEEIFNTEYIQKRLEKDNLNSELSNNSNKDLSEPTCWVVTVVAAGVAIVVAAVAVVNAVAGVNWALGANVGAAVNVAYAANYVKNRDRLGSISEQYSFSHAAVAAVIKTMNVH